MYNKLFAKILDSSIWLEPTSTRIVWLTFLAAMDQNGFAQFAAPANVAHRAIVTLEEAEEAIRCLEAEDVNSSNPVNNGRRIERVPGGWMVLNAEEHKRLVSAEITREQTRLRVQRHRESKRTSNAHVTTSETETETEVQTKTEEKARAYSGETHESVTETRQDVVQGGAPIHDASHRKHAFCGRVCLHSEQFGAFVRRRNTPNADHEIREWAFGIIKDWTDGPNAHVEPGDSFDFWRARYEDQWPSPPQAGKSKLPAWARK